MSFRPFSVALAFCLAMVACAQVDEDIKPLKPGTRIKLVIQRTLSTHPKGGVLGVIGVKPVTREGTLLLFEVAEDVFNEDGVLILQAGAPATGTVIDSQVGGGIKPHAPRLAVTVERVLTVDGDFVPLRFDRKHEGKWAKVFNRGETGAWVNRFRSDAIEKVFAKPEHSDASRELFELVVTGRIGDLFRYPARALKLRYLADQSGLPTLARYLQDGKIFQLASLIAEIQTGVFVLRSLTDARRLYDAFRLMDETWRAGAQLLDWLGGRIKAPQIVVPAGFPVDAVVAEDRARPLGQ
jgi:hypothetical protein